MTFQELKAHYSGKRILLTGHTGFKGSWMLKVLKQLGAEVAGLALAADKLSHYNDIHGDDLCTSVEADIRDKAAVEALVSSFKPDVVFHMAAQPLVLDGYERPVYTFEVNGIGTANLLDALRGLEQQCEIIVITTDKVYDNKEWYYPYREDDALGGYDPYSASKACTELISNSYRSSFFNPADYENHKKALVTVRAGNVIGGGDWAANRIIPDIARAISRDEAVVLRSPYAVRPWQHVLEALYGYLLLGVKLFEAPKKFSEAFNFGPLYDESVTVEQLVQTALRVWEKGSYEIEGKPVHPHEAKLLRLDCSKAVNMLQWKPKWNAVEAIEKTIEWYKAVMDKTLTPTACTDAQIASYFSKQ